MLLLLSLFACESAPVQVGPIHNDGINCTVTMWTR